MQKSAAHPSAASLMELVAVHDDPLAAGDVEQRRALNEVVHVLSPKQDQRRPDVIISDVPRDLPPIGQKALDRQCRLGR